MTWTTSRVTSPQHTSTRAHPRALTGASACAGRRSDYGTVHKTVTMWVRLSCRAVGPLPSQHADHSPCRRRPGARRRAPGRLLRDAGRRCCLDSGARSEAAVVDGTDASSGAPAGITTCDEDAVVEADREIVTTGGPSSRDRRRLPGASRRARRESAGGAGREPTAVRSPRATRDPRPCAYRRLRTTATVDALGQVGEVRDLAIEAVDVTGTARDLDARVAALTTSARASADAHGRRRDDRGPARRRAGAHDAPGRSSSRSSRSAPRSRTRSRCPRQRARGRAGGADGRRPGGFLGRAAERLERSADHAQRPGRRPRRAAPVARRRRPRPSSCVGRARVRRSCAMAALPRPTTAARGRTASRRRRRRGGGGSARRGVRP